MAIANGGVVYKLENQRFVFDYALNSVGDRISHITEVPRLWDRSSAILGVLDFIPFGEEHHILSNALTMCNDKDYISAYVARLDAIKENYEIATIGGFCQAMALPIDMVRHYYQDALDRIHISIPKIGTNRIYIDFEYSAYMVLFNMQRARFRKQTRGIKLNNTEVIDWHGRQLYVRLQKIKDDLIIKENYYKHRIKMCRGTLPKIRGLIAKEALGLKKLGEHKDIIQIGALKLVTFEHKGANKNLDGWLVLGNIEGIGLIDIPQPESSICRQWIRKVNIKTPLFPGAMGWKGTQ